MDPQGPHVVVERALELPPSHLPEQASLFLDFDGTLVDLIDRPDAVQVTDRVRALIAALCTRLDGRLAIVTGREAAFVRAQLGLKGVGIAGSHGQEIHFPDGTTSIPETPATLADAANVIARLAAAHEGVLVERKPLGVALHYRMAPQLEGWSRALAEELAESHGLHLQPGKMMVELRAPGGDKGSAVARFLDTPPFAGTVPVMLGDDLTDEPGFAAAAAHGGWGVLVGPERPTEALYRLEGVQHVLAWLEGVLDA
ncbi:trehalose-phosphatase [Novosphingobium sp. 17-62-19]|uniref:trehalose-phosphatase n=1 Tax=Novosphingobium sp. 17-62-19 TaxID=1970406 RepID=UPI0025D6A725|nr:trehalose-phosphatase [Novosphingobium sp. 17-62-19]HQS95967.1 trehalose-phosphatase [Novosphingobium sp.]